MCMIYAFVVIQAADIAAAPMYVTAHRASVVSFTEPYMTVQATLLLRKPPAGATVTIREVSELINQSEIKYGTLNRGVLVRAFKRTNETMFKIMWRNMMRFDDSVTETNEEGIERVRREKYGFVLPNTIGEYISMREPCDLVTVGRFLMKRGYALAVQRQSPWLHQVNEALTTLRDSGYLDGLYRRWWIGRSECNGIRSSKIYSISSAGWNSPVLSIILLAAAVQLLHIGLVS